MLRRLRRLHGVVMGKGIMIAHGCNADGVPDFVTGSRLDKFNTLIPNRRHAYYLDGRDDPEEVIYLFQLHNSAGTRLEVSALNRCVWWLSSVNVSNTRARKLLKWVSNNVWQWGTRQQVEDNNTQVGLDIKASPDMRQPLTHDPANGNVLTWGVQVMWTPLGTDFPTDASGTTAAEITGATEEPWPASFSGRPLVR